jgi:endothelin-converting enzyme/putative endopeptidase
MRIIAILLLTAAVLSAEPPKTSGLDPNAIDRSVDPCQNFYQYACGNWMASNPIPTDRSRWGRFDELAERNRSVLHDILEKASSNDPARAALDQKIGDYFASCMDETAITRAGLKALKPELDRIQALADQGGLAAEVAHLHLLGAGALFRFGSAPHMKDSGRMIASLSQGGLGLPDRDYSICARTRNRWSCASNIRRTWPKSSGYWETLKPPRRKGRSPSWIWKRRWPRRPSTGWPGVILPDNSTS